jgi:hypothetical protein
MIMSANSLSLEMFFVKAAGAREQIPSRRDGGHANVLPVHGMGVVNCLSALLGAGSTFSG